MIDISRWDKLFGLFIHTIFLFSGPVVFPTVENPIVESSGVVVGASGFGFVPPGSSSKV